MKDRSSRLDQSLRNLPREQASEGFRDKVLRAARVEAVSRRSQTPWLAPRMVPALAAAALLLAMGISLGLYMMERTRRAELRREIAELRQEHERLDAEVELLRQEARGTGATGRRVIYLGGDDTVDYVLDLERLARQGARGRFIPAALPVAGPYSGGEL